LHPESGRKRITLSAKVINNAAKIIFLVTGDSKANIIKEIFNQDESKLKKYPSANIKPVDGMLEFLIDENAAKLLTGN